jgi:hypothetical protein
MPETTIMQNFGVLNPDGTISDVARQKLIDYHQQYSENGQLDLPFECTPKGKPNPYHNADLGNKEKYKAWHDRWIDGFYKTLVDALDKPASSTTFMLPIFDPTGVAAALNLPIPDLSFPAILGAFAMPIPACAAALDIKVDKLPDFTASLFKLIKVPPKLPGIPEIPVPVLPSGDLLFSPPLISLQGFNIAFFKALLPGVLLSFITDIAKPDFWISFTPAKLFEGACKAVQAAIPPPETSLPTEYLNNTSMITVAAADLIAARAANEIVGATTLLKILGQQRGYTKHKQPNTTKDQEALLNNLVKFKDGLDGGQQNTYFIFPKRESWYGDQFTIDTINALAKHLQDTNIVVGTSNINGVIKQTAYPLKDGSNQTFTLQIGNMTLKETKGVYGFIKKEPGWRFNHYSKTHAGSSFDCAYPMRDPDTKLWISGIGDNATTAGFVEEEDVKNSAELMSPYLAGNTTVKGYSSAYEPYTVPGNPGKIDPILLPAYKKTPLSEEDKKALKDAQEVINATPNGPPEAGDEEAAAQQQAAAAAAQATIDKMNPPLSQIDVKDFSIKGGVLPHDFAVMFEMGRWIYNDWIPKLMDEGRLLVWNHKNQAATEKIKFCPIPFIIIGIKIYHVFSYWASAYIKQAKKNEGPLDKPIAIYKGYGWNVDYGKGMFATHKAHEDHMHWTINRSYAKTGEDGKTYYYFENRGEGNWAINGIDPSGYSFFRYDPQKIELGNGISDEDKQTLASKEVDANGNIKYVYNARK